MNFSTNRLVIREFTEADVAPLTLQGSDPAVTEHMPWGPLNMIGAERLVKRAIQAQSTIPRTDYVMAVCLKSTGALVGGGGLYIESLINRQASLCYWFGRAHWGQGYAIETLSALLELGFDEIGLHRMVATCSAGNTRSSRVLERRGMRLEGRMRQDVWLRSEWRDSLLFAVLDFEWEAMKGRSS